MSHTATSHCVEYTGPAVFADVDKVTGNISLRRSKINIQKTKGIIIVHMAGISVT